MNIHEYQAKRLFTEHGIPVPTGAVAASAQQAAEVARASGAQRWVVKAQIYAGGRGDGHFAGRETGAGGIRFADSLAQLERDAADMLGNTLLTEQTGPGGREVEHVYVEEACEVERELYLSMLVDRETSRVTLIASARGGIDIEKVAVDSPSAIHKLAIDPRDGLHEAAARSCIAKLRLEPGQEAEAARIAVALYGMFTELDASLIEINPLAIVRGGQMLALDAVIAFDDNALYRHEEIRALRDEAELRVGELAASHHGLNYIKLDGNIGCVASGAGMAMATVDAVCLLGGKPANFLDVPPDAPVDRIKDACKLLLADPDVQSILVNVFGGGIMRCDHFADGILLANREVPLKVPMVVRLSGTNATLGRQRLRDSGPDVVFAGDLAEAARQAVSAASDTRLLERKSWWRRTQQLLQRG
ncbi:MAG: ADP-forming succinate--CoA ligase subunit beta [Gammaproteobacteria bacterium]|nr:ADP-forming succinate--CoA ligase subunit beta [Gammaproteobacteria bacterium]